MKPRTCQRALVVVRRRISRRGRRRRASLKSERKWQTRKIETVSNTRHKARTIYTEPVPSDLTAYVSSVEEGSCPGESSSRHLYPKKHVKPNGQVIMIQSILSGHSRRQSFGRSQNRVQFIDQLPKPKTARGKLPEPLQSFVTCVTFPVEDPRDGAWRPCPSDGKARKDSNGDPIRVLRDAHRARKRCHDYCRALRDAAAVEEDVASQNGQVFVPTKGYPILVTSGGDAYVFPLPHHVENHDLGRTAVAADASTRKSTGGAVAIGAAQLRKLTTKNG